MKKSQIYSLLLHLVMLLLLIFGLPDFMHRKIEPEPVAISVEILPVSQKSNVKPQEEQPEPEKKVVEQKPVEKKPTPPATKAVEKPPEPEKVMPQEIAKKEDVKIPEKPREIVKPQPPKKIEPPKKPEPPKKEKPRDEDLESILNSVKETAKTEPAEKPKPNTAPKKQAKAESQNYDDSAPLSMSEKDGIIQQIQRCWNVPAGAKDADSLIVPLHIELTQDGTVTKVELSGESSRYHSDSFFRAAADSAMRAVRKCSPLKNLPAEKYGNWQVMELNFNPKDAL